MPVRRYDVNDLPKKKARFDATKVARVAVVVVGAAVAGLVLAYR